MFVDHTVFFMTFGHSKLVLHKMRPLWGDITMCFWSSRNHLCVGSPYWIKDRSRRSYVWL